MTNLNKTQKVLFWYTVVISFGLIFVMAWIDGLKPSELVGDVRT